MSTLALGGEWPHADRSPAPPRARVERADAQLQMPGGDAAEVEQVVEQLRLQPRVALDGLERRALALAVQRPRAQNLHPAEDGVERHPQLARRLGQERRPILFVAHQRRTT